MRSSSREPLGGVVRTYESGYIRLRHWNIGHISIWYMSPAPYAIANDWRWRTFLIPTIWQHLVLLRLYWTMASLQIATQIRAEKVRQSVKA